MDAPFIKGFSSLLSQSDIAIKMYPVNPVFAPCAAIEEREGRAARRGAAAAVNKLVRGQAITGDAVRAGGRPRDGCGCR